MNKTILLAVFMITLAFVLYTIATGLNWRAKRLTGLHIAIFWCAVASDAFATNRMAATLPVIIWDIHTLVGYGSLALMAALSLYGTVLLWQKRENLLSSFHRIAVPVWVIWTASYVSGIMR